MYRVLALWLLMLGGCATNPVTGGAQLALISEAQEIQMGQQVAQGAEAQLGLVNDPGLQAYVTALARQPKRIEIISLPRSMTLEQLNRAYPSSIPMVELALINRLSDVQDTVPEGFLFKRVR